MIETLFAKRANATKIYTIVTINAIIFQHASLETIDNIVDAFHSVATILSLQDSCKPMLATSCS